MIEAHTRKYLATKTLHALKLNTDLEKEKRWKDTMKGDLMLKVNKWMTDLKNNK